MKTRIPALLLFLTFLFLFPSYSQISNLVVNGSSTSFSMVSGDTISWSYNVPAGATTVFEIWLDINLNGLVDTSTDKMRMSYTQTDGGGTGLPDMDGTLNGQVTFSIPVGFAPATFLYKFSQGGVSLVYISIVTHLVSPAHTISGHITSPPGISAANIFVQAKRSGNHQPGFWEAVSDSLGNYIIETSDDTVANPWTVEFGDMTNPFLPYSVLPATYSITLFGSYSGLDFSYQSAAAKVLGYLKDEFGVPISNTTVSTIRFQPDMIQERRTTTDVNGFFELDYLVDDLSNDDYKLASYYSINTDFILVASQQIHGIHAGDSIFRNLVSYYANSSIQGTVRINGQLPGMPITLHAVVYDTAFTFTVTDSLTGNFSLPVSNKLYNYMINPGNTSGYYGGMNVTAHPGQTGLVINLLCNLSSISGVVFNDINGSGNQEVGEHGLPGWTINLSGWGTGTTTTNEFGQYSFNNLQPGTYTVSQQLQSGWEQTKPISPWDYTGTLYAGDNANGLNFGNHEGGGDDGIQISIAPRWNLVSLPCLVEDRRAASKFPTATSLAMAFIPDFGYQAQDSLNYGAGYWMKFASSQIITISGTPMLNDTFDVSEGWNIIGSLSQPLRTDAIASIPPGLVTSSFYTFGYLGYTIVDTIIPGRGYWVKVNQNGKLILSSSPGFQTANRIHIVRSSELPPTPPTLNENDSPLPERYSLSQNYPNPFNPSTIIKYELPFASTVLLKVYNLLGQEVVTLVNGFEEAGFKSVEFNADKLTGGMYFYKLTAGTFTDVKKLLFLR